MNSIQIENTKRKREPNYELLRVFSMFFIVVWHFIYHGMNISIENHPAMDTNSWVGIMNFLAVSLLKCITSIGVDCFVMITGYFMIRSSFRWEKLVKIWLQVFFYSMSIYIVFSLLWDSWSIPRLVKNLLPVRFEVYWFVTKYMALMFLSPFLNKMIEGLKKSHYQMLLLLLFVINFKYLYGEVFGNGASLLWFIFLYLLAGYIRMFDFKIKTLSVYGGKIFLFFNISLVAFDILSQYVLSSFTDSICIQYTDNRYNGMTFFAALIFFLWIKQVKIQNTKIIRILLWMAPYTLGVYLIHEHLYSVRWIWPLIGADQMFDNIWLLPVMFITSVVIFITCILIDRCRCYLFQYIPIENYAITKIQKIIDYIYDKYHR